MSRLTTPHRKSSQKTPNYLTKPDDRQDSKSADLSNALTKLTKPTTLSSVNQDPNPRNTKLDTSEAFKKKDNGFEMQ